MKVLAAERLPSHALVILDASETSTPAVATIAPIDICAFQDSFDYPHLHRPSHPIALPHGKRLGVPYADAAQGGHVVTLPTLILHAHHAESMPLLLLFGLWHYLPSPQPRSRTPSPSPPSSFHTTATSPSSVPSTPPPTPASAASFSLPDDTHGDPDLDPDGAVSIGLLATYVLPVDVLGEFPALPAMADQLARGPESDAVLDAWRARCRGFWGNVLALAPADGAIVEMARTAWSVTSEARKRRRGWREWEGRMRAPIEAEVVAAALRKPAQSGPSEQ
jgi:hypothetical protein